MEDLWCFNDEGVARTIAASEIPVISAVGHEPDVTIADYAADLRAATPSNGAELAVPDQNDIYAGLFQLERRMNRAMERRVEQARARLDRVSERKVLRDPLTSIQLRRTELEHQARRLASGAESALGRERERLARLAAGLDAMSPLKVLARGYAIARTEDGTVVRSRKDVKKGEAMEVRVTDGAIHCRVE